MDGAARRARSAPQLDGHAAGWIHFLGRLRIAAPGGDPGPDDWQPGDAPDLPATAHPHPPPPTHRNREGRTGRTPGGGLVGKTAYHGFLAGFAPSLTGLTENATVADGDRVALFYYPHTASTSTAVAAECFTVRGAKIVERARLRSAVLRAAQRPDRELTVKPDQAALVERVRARLVGERTTREVPMFGGRSFMVNDAMIVSALGEGDLLVRVARERDAALIEMPGASRAEMGVGHNRDSRSADR